ncbi:hypothetical protein GGTG_09675 [Gaeumannomyces tritici R3-111a-1]|uniref:Nitrogen regulatory protein areA GATA-like domain-containing protein n=1 Tax=Gaeumannomyces tritici (strain R3-111a-1) TaxID=644352 RepID=J3P837_GAET3|nr:hypothetical protein GGTG_09675 [Gaeumannomyces tritici R3-111a-1]EJT72820.1 hypothetical protein GGTG_09675 [Gaeumannomyces tritici R3-111a-1]
MAVVLQTDDNSYFQTSALRRSHSQPKFGSSHSSFHSSASASRISDAYAHQPVKVYSDSAISSETLSPHILNPDSSDLSYPSTPTTATSSVTSTSSQNLAPPRRTTRHHHRPIPDEDDSDFAYPGSDASYLNEVEDLEPPPSPRTGDSYSVSPNGDETSTTEESSHPVTPDFYDHADDDIAVRALPSRHVDYLSHNWREEDIWESWKYIVARKADYSNAARLENASWRTWMKSKNKLRTISPETLNWLKDCDVTWLYGPLQTGFAGLDPNMGESSEATMPKSPSHVKKPILKKRSMSEVMLQRSISTSSLVKQAAAAVQAQQKEGAGGRLLRPRLERAATDYITLPLSSRRHSPGNSSHITSSSSSRLESPAGERKHIHFKEEVEQCIAVEVKGEDDEDFDNYRYPAGYDSDSDNDAIMMKRTAIKKRRPVLKRNKSSSGEKTIAMLPSTTLKYREDTPEPPEASTAMKHSYRSPTLTPSSSQETLKPSKSKSSGKGMLFADDDDDDDDDDEDEQQHVENRDEEGDDDDSDDDGITMGPSRSRPAVSLLGGGGSSSRGLSDSLSGSSGSGLKRTTSSSSLSAEPTGMRRTESARDIAHVIWNVGWRK